MDWKWQTDMTSAHKYNQQSPIMDKNFHLYKNVIKIHLNDIKGVRNPWVTKSSYEIELQKLMSHFELLTRKLWYKLFFQVINLTLQIIKFRVRATNLKLKNETFTSSYALDR